MQSELQSTLSKKTFRQSNIELLRIVAMLLIICHHFSLYSGFNYPTDTLSINRLWVQFVQMGGKIGVNIFILISGYFLVSAQSIKTSKIVKFWGQVFFYSMCTFVIFVASGLRPFGIEELIHHLFPIIFAQWWFPTLYFLLLLLAPYINRFLRTMDRLQYACFLVVLSIIWCIIPTFTEQMMQCNLLLCSIFVYSIGGYIKTFNVKVKSSSLKLIGLAIFTIGLTFSTVILFDYLGIKHSFFANRITTFYDMWDLPIIIISVLLFLGFIKINIPYNKYINAISAATFGVYLIHENGYIRPIIWDSIFKTVSYSNSNMLIPYSLFVIVAIFAGCTIIEVARIQLIENNCIKIINRTASFIDKRIDRWIICKIKDRIR